jgi:hypothetical protein
VTADPLVVTAPVTGRVLPMSDVPDLVFAEEMVGPGVAVDPDPGPGAVVAPVDGQVVVLHAHAFVVQHASRALEPERRRRRRSLARVPRRRPRRAVRGRRAPGRRASRSRRAAVPVVLSAPARVLEVAAGG